ncbi:MAG: BamA/TamA family outer membrane protein, partial [Acidimicrobiia bacterium]
SSRTARTNFALRETNVGGAVVVHPSYWLSIGERVEYLTPRIGRGTDPRFPSTELVFSEPQTPGLTAQPDFVRAETFVSIDYGDPPLNPRAGGRYRLSYQQYHDRDLDRFSFARFDVDFQQYVPFWKRHRTIVLRALASLSDADAGHEVPFYLQRTLGGAYSVRGFRAFRFRDRNLLLLQAEYRWEINPFVTGAIFYDAGKVAAHREDLDLNDLERSYGFGLRLGSRAGVAIRAEAAFGSGEGTRFLLRFNNVF